MDRENHLPRFNRVTLDCLIHVFARPIPCLPKVFVPLVVPVGDPASSELVEFSVRHRCSSCATVLFLKISGWVEVGTAGPSTPIGARYAPTYAQDDRSSMRRTFETPL